jgi:hypothetical protein
MVKILLGKPN